MMGIEALRNTIHREVARVLYRFTRRIPCVVSSYNPAQHAVKVKLLPEGTLTGWIQIQADQVGGQVAPNIGDPGWLDFHEADRRAAVFVGSNHNDQNPPPVQIQSGERRWQTKWGQFIYFKSDGSITVADGAGATAVLKSGVVTATDKAGSTTVLDGAGNANITGTQKITLSAPIIVLHGNIEFDGTCTGGSGGTIELGAQIQSTAGATFDSDVTAGGISVENHTHSGVQTGGGETGPPQG